MGVFDYLRCEHRLPDGWVPTKELQTKDTPAQWMELYVLREDGTLVDEKSGEAVPFHGCLEFYTSNWSGSCPTVDGPSVIVTDDGQPPWSAEYEALFDRGKLIRIDGRRSVDVLDPAKVRWVNWTEFAAASAEWAAHQAAARDAAAESQ
ncbi:MAG TPA: hypothetical protein VHG32_07795 [Thermoanaerobaculia bacterium]|jgi:hypothetical protein|nr:hypothetical protein [Thermoanaerobaculia bacterium]